MKKKFLILLVCFLQFSVFLFADEKITTKRIMIYEYTCWADRLVKGNSELDVFKITVACPVSNGCADFMIGKSGFSNEDVSKLLKKFYLETYDDKKYLSSSSAAEYMYYCLLKIIQEKYGSVYAAKLPEFELENIEMDGNMKLYEYFYTFPD